MTDHPCRFYGAEPDGDQELIYALRLSAPVTSDRWQALLDDIWGETGSVFEPPDGPDAWWFEEATEQPGRVDVAVDPAWAIIYQNVFDPIHSREDIEQYEKAFRTHAAALGIVEIVALYGRLFEDHPGDAWTVWSLERAMPSAVVTSDGRRWKSPWDEYEALLAGS